MYVFLCCTRCNTMVEQGNFPESIPFRYMTSWIDDKESTLGDWHKCLLTADLGELSADSSSDTGLYSWTSKLRDTGKRIARMVFIIDRV